jgi:hypothetical protein
MNTSFPSTCGVGHGTISTIRSCGIETNRKETSMRGGMYMIHTYDGLVKLTTKCPHWLRSLRKYLLG